MSLVTCDEWYKGLPNQWEKLNKWLFGCFGVMMALNTSKPNIAIYISLYLFDLIIDRLCALDR